MKHNLSHILKKISDADALSSSEKEKLSRVVSEYVSLKPITREVFARATTQTRTAGFFAFGMRPLALALSLAIIVSGAGVSYAAEFSVPGDILYPIKVSANEEVRGAFAGTLEKKAAFEALRAERRLEEAATLAVRGKLNDARREYLADRFGRHASVVERRAETLEEEDITVALDVATEFETRLAAHEALLRELNGASKPVLAALKEHAGKIAAIRLRAEGRLAARDEAAGTTLFNAALPTRSGDIEGRKADEETGPESEDARTLMMSAPPSSSLEAQSDSVEMPRPEPARDTTSLEAISRARGASEKARRDAVSIFERVSPQLPESDQESAKELLAKADEALTTGAEKLERGDREAALARFRASLGLSQRLIVFLKAAVRLDIRLITLPEDEAPAVLPDDDLSDVERKNSLLPGTRELDSIR